MHSDYLLDFFGEATNNGLNYFTENYQYKSGITNPNVPLDLNVNKWLVKAIYDYDALNYWSPKKIVDLCDTDIYPNGTGDHWGHGDPTSCHLVV